MHESILQMWPAGIKCSPPPHLRKTRVHITPWWAHQNNRYTVCLHLLSSVHVSLSCYGDSWKDPPELVFKEEKSLSWVSAFWRQAQLYTRKKTYETIQNGTWNFEYSAIYCLLHASRTNSWRVSGIKPAVLRWLPGCCVVGVPPTAANHGSQLRLRPHTRALLFTVRLHSI